MLRSGELILASGPILTLFDSHSMEVRYTIADLSVEGVQRIDAITVDAQAGTLEMVDGGSGHLVRVNLHSLGL